MTPSQGQGQGQAHARAQAQPQGRAQAQVQGQAQGSVQAQAQGAADGQQPQPLLELGAGRVTLRLEYLVSYQHMGVVRLTCSAGCACAPQRIDAHQLREVRS